MSLPNHRVTVNLTLSEIESVFDHLGKITMGEIETPVEASGLRKVWKALLDKTDHLTEIDNAD